MIKEIDEQQLLDTILTGLNAEKSKTKKVAAAVAATTMKKWIEEVKKDSSKHFSSGDPAMRAAQAMEYIGLRHSAFYKLVAEGRIPQGVYIGRVRIWRRSWLDAFLDSLGAKSVAIPE